MFKKPHKPKSESKLRASDIRRVNAEISATYGFPSVLLDKDTSIKKVVLHSSEICEIIVCHSLPLFFSIPDLNIRLYPTVYSMWKHPELLRLNFETNSTVLSKIANGADLMVPGVQAPAMGFTSFKEGDVCSISVCSVPMAVGRSLVASSKIEDRGKLVSVVHCVNDHLWALGDKSLPPDPATITKLVNSDAETHVTSNSLDIEAELSNLQLEKNENSIQSPNNEIVVEADEDKPSELSITEIDAILERALLTGLLFLASDETPGLLPMSISNVYSHYVLPYRENENVDVKNSSHKKVVKFLKAYEKIGIIKLKELRSDWVLTTINTSND
ncbi:Eukaryotic translation initiation factor 2D, partial [Nowakowskiella sp. JEL0078]